MGDRGAVPTLSEWVGGEDRIAALTARFYDKVPTDPVIGPVFAHMDRGMRHTSRASLPRCSAAARPAPTMAARIPA